eukprot:scaffold87253_cov70-Phaeocystis_antarctica.AAC.1
MGRAHVIGRAAKARRQRHVMGRAHRLRAKLSTVCNASKFVGCGEGGGEAGGAMRYAGDGSVRRTAATRQFSATLTHSPIKSRTSRGVHEAVERPPRPSTARVGGRMPLSTTFGNDVWGEYW